MTNIVANSEPSRDLLSSARRQWMGAFDVLLGAVAFVFGVIGVAFWSLFLGPQGARRLSPAVQCGAGGVVAAIVVWLSYAVPTSNAFESGVTLRAAQSLVEPPLWFVGWVFLGLAAGTILGMLTDPRDDGD